ncbi:restriction endonuclease subunit S [Gudongella sp. DL1XJH-153]|uniref:restriction endonuclease subunit S n=1 Tax=Gudongella sp. DL1XJH-153 TaxID=3409804 RepID=UPI003BB4B65C
MSFKETEIGLIPPEWKYDSIRDSLYIKGRIGWKGLKKSEYLEHSEFRIINGSNIIENKVDWFGCGYISEERYLESPEIILRPNDIIMTKDGTIGKLAIVKELSEPSTVASGLFVIRIENNEIDVYYLFYYLTSPFFKKLIKSRTEGSVIPHLYQKDLLELKLPLPLLQEQKAIAHILSTLDEKIEVNNRINKTLEEMAQEIFKHWFVDFEFYNEDGDPYKSSGGEMIESEFGMIPKGWQVINLGEIISLSSGKRPRQKLSEASSEFEIPLVGASSIMSYTNEFNYNESVLVIGRVGTHGVVQRYNDRIWASDNTLVIKSKYYEYVYQILNSIDYSAINRGSTQPLITQTDIKKHKVLKPGEGLFEKFENLVGKNNRLQLVNQKQNSVLESIRNTLLPKLMSGEIRVPLDTVEQ